MCAGSLRCSGERVVCVQCVWDGWMDRCVCRACRAATLAVGLILRHSLLPTLPIPSFCIRGLCRTPRAFANVVAQSSRIPAAQRYVTAPKGLISARGRAPGNKQKSPGHLSPKTFCSWTPRCNRTWPTTARLSLAADPTRARYDDHRATVTLSIIATCAHVESVRSVQNSSRNAAQERRPTAMVTGLLDSIFTLPLHSGKQSRCRMRARLQNVATPCWPCPSL